MDIDVNERHERVLLRPWLENMLETGDIPGLEWYDRDRMMFKVPWKHRSKKDWSIRHSSVFLEWARNTGRWSEGDPTPYFAQLKTRLRCAFNKAPDIEEMKEFHSRNCEEPYKVYRFTTRKTGNGLGGPGSLQRTTVTISAPRRVAQVKTEMYTDEDLQYSDVENIRTEFSSGYFNEFVPTPSSSTHFESVHQELLTANATAVKPKSSAYSSKLVDQKFGVIPITVEELSSAESDDSAHEKTDWSRKQGSISSDQPSDGAQSKLLMLQMASMFVEAEASRQLSTDDSQNASDAGDSEPNGEVTTDRPLSAPLAIDLTLKDQLISECATDVNDIAPREDVMDLTAKVISAIEAVDLTRQTEGRILPLPRYQTSYSEQSLTSLVGSQSLKTSRLLTPLQNAPAITPSANDVVRSVTSLTIRSRPLFGGQPMRHPVASISTRITLSSPLTPARLLLSSPNTNTGTQSIAPVSLTTIPVVTVPRITHRSPPVIAGVVTTKPVPVFKKMMIQTAQSDERSKSNVTTDSLKLLPQQQSLKSESITQPMDVRSKLDGATTEEIRRHYYAKEQILIAKAQALLEKEKQLLMWEKQLLAKQEALYWKERCVKQENEVQSNMDTTPSQEEADKTRPINDNEIIAVANRDGNVMLTNEITGLVEVQTPGAAASQISRNPLQLDNISSNATVNGNLSTIAALLKANRFPQPPMKLVTSPVDQLPHIQSGAVHEIPTPRIVLPTLHMTPPITQQKLLRILPAPLKMMSQNLQEVASEKRLLPPVSLAKTSHLPVCVVESSDTSDQLSPSLSGELQESHDSRALDSSLTQEIAMGTTPHGSLNIVSGSQSGAYLEQIRLSTERIVQQFQRPTMDGSSATLKSVCDADISLGCIAVKSPNDDDVVVRSHYSVALVTGKESNTVSSRIVDCYSEADNGLLIGLVNEPKHRLVGEKPSGNSPVIGNSRIEKAYDDVENKQEVNQNKERSDNKRKLMNDAEDTNKVKMIRTVNTGLP